MNLGTLKVGKSKMELATAALTTHAVIVGMTGSGKTGLGVSLIEEAVLAGVPVIAIDPKGDLGNIALRFPNASVSEYLPFCNDDVTTAYEVSQQQGDNRRGAKATAYYKALDATVYTPGSTHGRALNVFSDMDPPKDTTDPERTAFRVSAVASAVLALIDADVDRGSQPHTLLCSLVAAKWASGQPVTLDGLVEALPGCQDVPFVGSQPVDEFMSPAGRSRLASQINAVLSSPEFQQWNTGDPFDIQQLLYRPDGKPRVSILSISHLDDARRMFLMTTLLSGMVDWMRKQEGTDDLRAMLYIDEVAGYIPPVRNPPSKNLLMTLLKQGRSTGVGVVLATQNPADVDYKVLSNAGTWFVGRLHTPQDRARLLKGVSQDVSYSDVDLVENSIASAERREFVVFGQSGPPRTFRTRGCVTWLRGPLSHEDYALVAGENRPRLVKSPIRVTVKDTATNLARAERERRRAVNAVEEELAIAHAQWAEACRLAQPPPPATTPPPPATWWSDFVRAFFFIDTRKPEQPVPEQPVHPERTVHATEAYGRVRRAVRSLRDLRRNSEFATFDTGAEAYNLQQAREAGFATFAEFVRDDGPTGMRAVDIANGNFMDDTDYEDLLAENEGA